MLNYFILAENNVFSVDSKNATTSTPITTTIQSTTTSIVISTTTVIPSTSSSTPILDNSTKTTIQHPSNRTQYLNTTSYACNCDLTVKN